jgi:hypothetical protein
LCPSFYSFFIVKYLLFWCHFMSITDRLMNWFAGNHWFDQ